MDESTKSLWDKTAAELTVKDQLVVGVGATVITVGLMAAVGATVAGWEKASEKFRTFRANRKNKDNTEA